MAGSSSSSTSTTPALAVSAPFVSLETTTKMTRDGRVMASENTKMADDESLKLMSSQGDMFDVKPEVACMSTLIKNIVDDSGGSADEDSEIIPLPNVKTAILSKVIDYCTQHVDTPAAEINPLLRPPLKSANLLECGVSEWDAEFVNNIEQEVLYELVLAANYLDIKPLLDLTCAKVASQIKGRSSGVSGSHGSGLSVNDGTGSDAPDPTARGSADPMPVSGGGLPPARTMMEDSERQDAQRDSEFGSSSTL